MGTVNYAYIRKEDGSLSYFYLELRPSGEIVLGTRGEEGNEVCPWVEIGLTLRDIVVDEKQRDAAIEALRATRRSAWYRAACDEVVALDADGREVYQTDTAILRLLREVRRENVHVLGHAVSPERRAVVRREVIRLSALIYAFEHLDDLPEVKNVGPAIAESVLAPLAKYPDTSEFKACLLAVWPWTLPPNKGE